VVQSYLVRMFLIRTETKDDVAGIVDKVRTCQQITVHNLFELEDSLEHFIESVDLTVA